MQKNNQQTNKQQIQLSQQPQQQQQQGAAQQNEYKLEQDPEFEIQHIDIKQNSFVFTQQEQNISQEKSQNSNQNNFQFNSMEKQENIENNNNIMYQQYQQPQDFYDRFQYNPEQMEQAMGGQAIQNNMQQLDNLQFQQEFQEPHNNSSQNQNMQQFSLNGSLHSKGSAQNNSLQNQKIPSSEQIQQIKSQLNQSNGSGMACQTNGFNNLQITVINTQGILQNNANQQPVFYPQINQNDPNLMQNIGQKQQQFHQPPVDYYQGSTDQETPNNVILSNSNGENDKLGKIQRKVIHKQENKGSYKAKNHKMTCQFCIEKNLKRLQDCPYYKQELQDKRKKGARASRQQQKKQQENVSNQLTDLINDNKRLKKTLNQYKSVIRAYFELETNYTTYLMNFKDEIAKLENNMGSLNNSSSGSIDNKSSDFTTNSNNTQQQQSSSNNSSTGRTQIIRGGQGRGFSGLKLMNGLFVIAFIFCCINFGGFLSFEGDNTVKNTTTSVYPDGSKDEEVNIKPVVSGDTEGKDTDNNPLNPPEDNNNEQYQQQISSFYDDQDINTVSEQLGNQWVQDFNKYIQEKKAQGLSQEETAYQELLDEVKLEHNPESSDNNEEDGDEQSFVGNLRGRRTKQPSDDEEEEQYDEESEQEDSGQGFQNKQSASAYDNNNNKDQIFDQNADSRDDYYSQQRDDLDEESKKRIKSQFNADKENNNQQEEEDYDYSEMERRAREAGKDMSRFGENFGNGQKLRDNIFNDNGELKDDIKDAIKNRRRDRNDQNEQEEEEQEEKQNDSKFNVSYNQDQKDLEDKFMEHKNDIGKDGDGWKQFKNWRGGV